MKIEITSDQFNLILKEITRLEEELPFLYEDDDKWGVYYQKEDIKKLKGIIETEQVEV